MDGGAEARYGLAIFGVGGEVGASTIASCGGNDSLARLLDFRGSAGGDSTGDSLISGTEDVVVVATMGASTTSGASAPSVSY